MNIVINSCLDYKDKALPPLLESLQNAGVPKECIHIVLGQCDKEQDISIDGIQYHYRRWYNVDNNAMLWLTQEKPELNGEWIVYLHDTSLVADYFWNSCQNIIAGYYSFDAIKLYHMFSMGMGFYKTAFLYKDDVSSFMKSLENFDRNRLLDIKNQLSLTEDTIFKYGQKNNYRIGVLPNEYKVVEHDVKMYGSYIPRIKEFYQSPGIYKIKANYGQSSTLIVGV